MQVKLDGPKNISFSPQGIAYVLDTLAAQPFKDVNALINDIVGQLKAQEKSPTLKEVVDGSEPR